MTFVGKAVFSTSVRNIPKIPYAVLKLCRSRSCSSHLLLGNFNRMQALPPKIYIQTSIRRHFVILFIFIFGFLCGLTSYELFHKNHEPSVFSLRSKDTIENQTAHAALDKVAFDSLAKRVQLVCMIVTMPSNHDTKAVAVRDTWASRCDTHFFISSTVNPTLPSLAAVNEENREQLWSKTKYAIKYAAQNFSDYDFFLKADDDTYVVVENLHKLLNTLNPDDPLIMGRRFRPLVKQGYLSGGAGYVMSRAALMKISQGLHDNPKCADDVVGGAEDVRVGVCAEAVGVELVDTRDELGMERFHPFTPETMISKNALESIDWFKQYNYHNISSGMDCCSDYSITFHYVQYEAMYMFHYMLYHLRPYGIPRECNHHNKTE